MVTWTARWWCWAMITHKSKPFIYPDNFWPWRTYDCHLFFIIGTFLHLEWWVITWHDTLEKNNSLKSVLTTTLTSKKADFWRENSNTEPGTLRWIQETEELHLWWLAKMDTKMLSNCSFQIQPLSWMQHVILDGLCQMRNCTTSSRFIICRSADDTAHYETVLKWPLKFYSSFGG